jgi:hypothetical protein
MGHNLAFATWAWHWRAQHRHGLAALLLFGMLSLVTTGLSMILMLVAMCAPSCMTLSQFFQVCVP